MSITYNSNIPFSTHAPASDQPIMLTNALAISQIWGIDHNTFDSTGQGTSLSGSGRHLRVTFDGKNALTGTITDPLSVLYTANGTASTVSDLFFQNQNATYLINAWRAFIVFKTVSTNQTYTADSQYNFSNSVKASGAGSAKATIYTLTLTTGAITTGQPIGVITTLQSPSASAGTTPTWSISSNTLTITTSITTPASGLILSVAVFQI